MFNVNRYGFTVNGSFSLEKLQYFIAPSISATVPAFVKFMWLRQSSQPSSVPGNQQ